MTKTFFTLIGIIGIAFILMSNDTGVASEASKDRTGSPFNAAGGLQCNACHTGGSFSTFIDTRLKDASGAIVTEYMGGETYTFEVEVTSTGASAYGFQSLALISSTDANAGTLNASSANTKIKVLGGTRRYAEHTSPSSTGLFIMNWTAPPAGSDTVIFYSAGNGVNSNGLNSGDKGVKAPSLIITESPLSGIKENKQNLLSLYPNPVIDQLTINPNFTGKGKLIVVSMNGKVELIKSILLEKDNPYTLVIDNIISGTYFVSLVDENGKQLASSKFLKK